MAASLAVVGALDSAVGIGVAPLLVGFCTLTDKRSNVINTLREREKARAPLFCTIHMLLNTLDLLVLNVQFLTNGGVTPSSVRGLRT